MESSGTRGHLDIVIIGGESSLAFGVVLTFLVLLSWFLINFLFSLGTSSISRPHRGISVSCGRV